MSQLAFSFSRSQNYSFHAAESFLKEAQVAVTQALGFLKESDTQRVSMVVPEEHVLGREISLLLHRAGVQHHDAVGFLAPNDADDPAFKQWLDWQRYPSFRSWLEIFECNPSVHNNLPCARADLYQFHQDLLTNTMTDDWQVALTLLEDRPQFEDLRAFLSNWKILPENAQLHLFLKETLNFTKFSNLEHKLEFIQRLEEEYSNAHSTSCTSPVFLRWIEQKLLLTYPRQRLASGNHPNSPIQILTYAQAAQKSHSYVILSGLNEGIYPSYEPPNFTQDPQILEIEQTVVSEAPGAATPWRLPSAEEIALQRREHLAQQQKQFFTILEDPKKISFTCSTIDPTNSTSLQPNAWLSNIYLTQANRVLDIPQINQLTQTSATDLINRHDDLIQRTDAGNLLPDLEQTRIAYLARRDSATPFGPYDFALSTSPFHRPLEELTDDDAISRQPASTSPESSGLLEGRSANSNTQSAHHMPSFKKAAIAAKKFELLLSQPEKLWIELFLNTQTPWQVHIGTARRISLGTLVHRGLHLALNPQEQKNWLSIPTATQAKQNLAHAFAQMQTRAQKTFHRAGWKLPDWWLAWFYQAQAHALELLELVLQIEGYPFLRTEWALPQPLRIPLPNGTRTGLKNKNDDTLSRQPASTSPECSNLLDEHSASSNIESAHQNIYQTSSTLHLKGQLDLVLARQAQANPDRIEGPAWIIDYKTGKNTFIPSKLKEGNGIQLALYGLALKQLGASNLNLSFLRKENALEADFTDRMIQAHMPLWQTLARMQETGIFGRKPRSEFDSLEPLPLATLEIEPSILQKRWKLTHPQL